ncbi:MAG: sensor histidine kinase [Alphaproteobacteria bacterium]
MNVSSVFGDPVQLQQVFLNLLVNACDAIDAAAEGPRKITIDVAFSEPQTVGVFVRDTGGGFDEPDLERMFEHFVSTKPRGLGMGLAISRSIVHAHGGRLWASRNAERGLTFHVELPCTPGG